MPKANGKSGKGNGAVIGFEAKLWQAADKLRNMDAAEYKHVVLGLIFLKYISDSFEEVLAKLAAGKGDYAGANPEDHLCAITVNALPADGLIRERLRMGKTDDGLAPGSCAFRRRHERRSFRRKLCAKEALNIDRQWQPLRFCLGEQTRFNLGR
jgi:type I restriction-modification system DNA methylase subunit